MVATHRSDVVRSLGLVSRMGRRLVAIPLPWKALCSQGGGKGLAMLATLLGAGSMGVLLVLRCSSGERNLEKLFSSDQRRSRDTVDQQELTVPGLQNAGNNCFLNVVLQALASSDVMVAFMEECTHGKRSPNLQAQSATMPLAVAVSSLLKELAQGCCTQRIVSPLRVMRALRRYVHHFDLAAQQDAAEALAHLAAGLQEERNNYLQLHRPILQSFATVLGESSLSPHLLQSWLRWPLEGTLGSLMTCQRCAFQFSTQFQFFNDIPLSLMQQADGHIIEACTLEDCLDQFTAPEWVTSVKCSRCAHMAAGHSLRTKISINKVLATQSLARTKVIEGVLKIIDKCSCDDDCVCETLTVEQGGVWAPVHTNASRRLQIGRSPEVLCLQIQRAVMSGAGELKKLTGHVSIPVVLNLFPYTVAAQEVLGKSTDTRADRHDDPLLQMVGQRGTLSHIRKLQQTGYPNPLFCSDLVCKGGGQLRQQEVENVKAISVASNKAAGGAEERQSSFVGGEESGPHDRDELCSFEEGAVSSSLNNVDGDATMEDKVIFLQHASPAGPSIAISGASEPTCAALTEPAVHKHFGSGVLPLQGPMSLASHATTGSGCTNGTNVVRPHHDARKLLYELLSVVVHHGSSQSGHYTVYRKMKLPKPGSQGLMSGCSMSFANTSSNKIPIGDVEDASLKVDQQHDGWELTMDGTKAQEYASKLDCSLYSRGNHNANLGGDSMRGIAAGIVDMEGCAHAEDVNNGRERSELLEAVDTKEDDTEVVWFKVSDTFVMRVVEEEVQTAKASLVFYERLKV